jgi:exosortase
MMWGLGIAAILLAGLMWNYWSTLAYLWQVWDRDPNYSVGQLVPLAAVWLLWHDRAKLRKCTIKPSWWGLVVILAAQAGRFFGVLFSYSSAEWYSLVLMIMGLVLLVAGWEVFWRTKWVLLFLFLMVPLPRMINNAVSLSLQQFSATTAAVLLDHFGENVRREGCVLILNDEVRIGVAEACSGLRMLTAFIVVAATLAYVVNRPRWQKVTLLISSIPIAIVCNMIRLFVTAELFLLTSDEMAEKFFHDFAGLTMMPLAFFILVGELVLMNKMIVPDGADGDRRHEKT